MRNHLLSKLVTHVAYFSESTKKLPILGHHTKILPKVNDFAERQGTRRVLKGPGMFQRGLESTEVNDI